MVIALADLMFNMSPCVKRSQSLSADDLVAHRLLFITTAHRRSPFSGFLWQLAKPRLQAEHAGYQSAGQYKNDLYSQCQCVVMLICVNGSAKITLPAYVIGDLA